MAADILVLEHNGILFLRGEKKQNSYAIGSRDHLSSGERRLYSRSGNEVVLDEVYLRELITEVKTKSAPDIKNLSVVLPQGIAWYHYMELEDMPEKTGEAHEFVMWKIQKILPIPKEQVELRLQVLSRTESSIRLLVVVTFKTFIVSLESCLRGMGIVPEYITTSTLSFLNVFENELPVDGVAVWMRENGSSMICFIAGEPVIIREVDRVVDVRRFETELSGFFSVIGESYKDFISERLVYFDELERADISEYVRENGTRLDIGALIARTGIDSKGMPRFVAALGAFE